MNRWLTWWHDRYAFTKVELNRTSLYWGLLLITILSVSVSEGTCQIGFDVHHRLIDFLIWKMVVFFYIYFISVSFSVLILLFYSVIFINFSCFAPSGAVLQLLLQLSRHPLILFELHMLLSAVSAPVCRGLCRKTRAWQRIADEKRRIHKRISRLSS